MEIGLIVFGYEIISDSNDTLGTGIADDLGEEMHSLITLIITSLIT